MIEHNGEIHFPESAVMDAVEFIYLEIKNIPVENIESKIIEAANRAFAKLANQSGLKENGLRSDDAAGIEDDKFWFFFLTGGGVFSSVTTSNQKKGFSG